jgi:hypothetical protein
VPGAVLEEGSGFTLLSSFFGTFFFGFLGGGLLANVRVDIRVAIEGVRRAADWREERDNPAKERLDCRNIELMSS